MATSGVYVFSVAGAGVAESGPPGVVVNGSAALSAGLTVSLLAGNQQSPACGNAGGSFVAVSESGGFTNANPLFGAFRLRFAGIVLRSSADARLASCGGRRGCESCD